ncbi:MAG: YlmH/Sll1252 family protein [Defluviitaleaceae bacterium]|nr:YlmH/Sll1252 family protein [Defluviitaleaceae bacterium]
MIENPFKDAEDKLLFAKTLDRLTAAQKKGQSTFTDFLDPARCEAFLAILTKKSPILPTAQGGHENAERKQIGFVMEDDSSSEAFPITPVTFTYNEKFSKPPTHRDYLGATIGLGLDRSKIGDIRLGETGAVMYVSTDVAAYICENLQQVGRTAVKGKLGESLPNLEEQGKEKRITVPSLRLDAVVSSAFNISRGKATALIESEKVFVNWKQAKKTQSISPNDTITIRGLGRATIDQQEGNTKKDRIVLRITKY